MCPRQGWMAWEWVGPALGIYKSTTQAACCGGSFFPSPIPAPLSPYHAAFAHRLALSPTPPCSVHGGMQTLGPPCHVVVGEAVAGPTKHLLTSQADSWAALV